MHETGWVDNGDRGIASVGDAGTRQALMTCAVGVLEVALERARRLREQHYGCERSDKAAAPRAN